MGSMDSSVPNGYGGVYTLMFLYSLAKQCSVGRDNCLREPGKSEGTLGISDPPLHSQET